MRQHRQGAMLLEVLVGLAVGAVVITSAFAALVLLRDAQRAIEDQSQLQQQAGFLMRAIGRQVHPAGSLDMEPVGDTGGFRYAAQPGPAGADGGAVVHGTSGDRHDSLTLTEPALPAPGTARVDCLGQAPQPDRRTSATFHADSSGKLSCRSSSGQNQPLAYGVAAFRTRYRLRDGAQVREMDADAVEQAGRWHQVGAIEVCIDLHGAPHSGGASAPYVDCTGHAVSDSARRHLVVRRLFTLRARETG